MSSLRSLANMLVAACLAVTPASAAECPTATPRSEAEVNADWDALYAELRDMRVLRELDFTVGGQPVYRLRSRGDSFAPDPLADRLRALRPRLEALFDEVGATRRRPVLLIESLGRSFADAGAFTVCVEDGERHFVIDALPEDAELPRGACLIVFYSGRMESSADADFSLAHEWFHTLQFDAYGEAIDGGTWWREGSADWFAHKVVPGVSERDFLVGEFFEDQRVCPLTEMGYPAQVFFFWAEQTFYSRWVFELGAGGRDYLRNPARAAQVLPPDRWNEYARAQVDEKIRFPDDRPLTDKVRVSPLAFASACSARVEGPPLSVQVRNLSLPEGEVLRVEPNGAQLSLRASDGQWYDLSAGGRFELPAGEAVLTAILPGAGALDARLWTGEGEGVDCGCVVGSWMEKPLDDGYRFRTALPEGAEGMIGEGVSVSVEYQYDGPILTIGVDGRFALDDPSLTSFSAGGEVFWQMKQTLSQRYGTWEEVRDGRLRLRTEGKRQQGTLTAAGVATAIDEDRRRRDRSVGGVWTPVCEGNLMDFYGPMEREMQASGHPPNLVARFTRVPAP